MLKIIPIISILFLYACSNTSPINVKKSLTRLLKLLIKASFIKFTSFIILACKLPILVKLIISKSSFNNEENNSDCILCIID